MDALGSGDANSRNLAMACHLLAFAGYVVPFGHIIGPLVLWLMKRERDPFVDHHGKEALNFQISMTIFAVAAGLIFATSVLTLRELGFLLGFSLVGAVMIFDLVFTVIAATKASSGIAYRYPLSLRLVR